METSDVVANIFKAAAALGLAAPTLAAKGKSYEIWVMLELATRLDAVGVVATPVGPNDALVEDFVFRGAPGHMPGADAGDDAPSHIRLERNDQAFEMHIGLQHVGVSEATHELDICVIPSWFAHQLRQDGGGPYRGPLCVALELKALSDKYKLDQGIPRALVGVAVDLDPTWPIVEWTFKTSGGHARSFTRSRHRERFSLVTATQLYNNSILYLEHHGARPAEKVLPGNNEHFLDDIVSEILDLFPA